MVIDAKIPPAEEASSAPPPAYPTSENGAFHPNPQHPQPSSSQPVYTPPGAPQQNTVYVEDPSWVGTQYRNQLFARCARGDHDITTTFGLCGIICAVLLFPIGLICLCLDTEKKCSRCGVRLG
ncbi:hypothetical protein OF83DRAFT_1049773 [Amylostereum chailletii]|nr:hypothetical protein OF83DRAFT_1049773 [Amylostereum chailletii]